MHHAARSTVILEQAMLSEGNLPDRLIAREGQIAELRRWLLPAVEARSAVHLWITGPSGAGKTATTMRTLAHLRDRGMAESAILNCWEHGTYVELLDTLVCHLRILRAEEHRKSLKLERIRQHLGDRPFVIALDEIDRMPPAEREAALYNLARLATVSLVAIANDEDALAQQRGRSRG